MIHFYNHEKKTILTKYRQPLWLDSLAAAYAEIGRYDDAISTAEEAHKIALVQGPDILARSLEKRLVLYRNKMPYRQTPNGKSMG